MDAASMETESLCRLHDDDDEEAEDCMSVCDACDERQRFALLDSPPVSVLTGTLSLIIVIFTLLLVLNLGSLPCDILTIVCLSLRVSFHSMTQHTL